MGRTEPRLLTEPLRPLTPRTSRGFDLVAWADSYLAQPLLDHQRLFYVHALELHPDDPGLYRHRELLMEGGRQGALKTSTGIVYCLWRLLEDDVDLCIISSAQRDNGREVFLRVARYLEDSPRILALARSIRRANGQESIDFGNGARFKVLGKPENARGNSAGIAWLDELLTHEDDDMWSAIRPTIAAQPRGQLLATSNAGTPRSVVLNNMRAAAVAGGADAPFIASWSSPSGREPDDWDGLAQALPTLGRLVPHSDIRSAMQSTSPNRFRAEYRCETIDAFDTLINRDAWNASGDLGGSLLPYRGQVTAGLDATPDGSVTLAVAMPLDGRERVAIAGRWESTALARKDLPGLLGRIRPRSLGIAPGPASAAVTGALRAVRPEPKVLTMVQLAEAHASFVDRANGRQILHPADPLLTSQALAVTKKPQGASFRFERSATGGNVDAVSAVAIAAWATRDLPARRALRVIAAG